jgi:hypothetical protein
VWVYREKATQTERERERGDKIEPAGGKEGCTAEHELKGRESKTGIYRKRQR